MTKTMTIVLLISAVLIGSSLASLLAAPVHPSQTRQILAGRAILQVPKNMPDGIQSGTADAGSVLLGSKDECDVTYDRFSGIYWSAKRIPASSLLPTQAYVVLSEQQGATLELGNGGVAQSRLIKLSAEKPCGKIVQDTLNVFDLYCSSSKTYFTIAAIQDPFMTAQKALEMAKSLKCT